VQIESFYTVNGVIFCSKSSSKPSFENFKQTASATGLAAKFSKVGPLLDLPSKMTMELKFENMYQEIRSYHLHMHP